MAKKKKKKNLLYVYVIRTIKIYEMMYDFDYFYNVEYEYIAALVMLFSAAEKKRKIDA